MYESGPDSYYLFCCDKCEERNVLCISGSWKAPDTVGWSCWFCGEKHLFGGVDELKEWEFQEEWEEAEGDEEKFKAILLDMELEEAQPHMAYDSASYEKVLDAACPYPFPDGLPGRPFMGMTWRLWFIKLAQARQKDKRDPMGLDRKGRREAIEAVISSIGPDEGWCRTLNEGFSSPGFFSREIIGRDSKGGAVFGDLDWNELENKLDGLLTYALGVW